MEFFTKNSKQKKEEERFISDIILNEPKENWEKLGVDIKDYTKCPEKLAEDTRNLSPNLSKEEYPIIKVQGLVAGLNTRLYEGDKHSNPNRLYYDGFLIIRENSPLYFCAGKTREEVPDLKLEKLMLESGKATQISMTGMFLPKNNSPGRLYPFVLELGGYISPTPKQEANFCESI